MYAELQASSNFSFLRGGSHPQEMAATASGYGYKAIAITDRNTLSGIVLAHSHLKKNESDTRLIVGARLDLVDGNSLLCYPRDRAAYGRLTRLLTLGRRRAQKGECILHLADVIEHGEGQHFICPFPETLSESAMRHIRTCADTFNGSFHLALTHTCRGDDNRWMKTVAEFAYSLGIPVAATTDALYHDPGRKMLQDVLTCIREKCTLEEAGFRLEANAERHLKPTREIAHLFEAWPHAVEATLEIAEYCRFSLDELRYEYPEEIAEPGLTPFEDLVKRTWNGAKDRFQDGIAEKVKKQLEHEFRLIHEREYAPYFLTVHDVVKFARSKGILCQGRGSAGNSLICYCLGITEADPVAKGLLFERFISAARNEPPDIDVDFEHERREEVIQHIYEKYGRERAGICATVVHYRTRRAVREVSKVLGLSEQTAAMLLKTVWGWSNDGVGDDQVVEAGFDPADPRLRLALDLSKTLIGFPRHLSQHVGGFVIARGRLDELVPIENATMEDRTIVQWDKNDIDELGMMKVDILALGMLTAIRRSFDLLERHYGIKHDLHNVPSEDPAVYKMLQRADSIGVFQVESRAQQSMLPRLKPATFYDLVIEVAIVRPGPIQGDMVHPYLRRREGKEKVEYPSEELKNILSKTLGVPLFQEQAMQIAITGAGFTPNEADQLRRSLATFRHVGTIKTHRERFISGMLAKNYSLEFAERCFSQIEGFGTYGFPEAHAISFANLVYVSAWIKCNYPAVFCAALLNSQPMGFYAPAQLVRDAREHGVEVRPIDVNLSDWDTTLQPTARPGKYAIRLGLRLVAGLSEKDATRIVNARGTGYTSLEEIVLRSKCSRLAIDRLAQADAFASMRLKRRPALWRAGAVERDMPPLFRAAPAGLFEEPKIELPRASASQEVVEDYVATGLTLRKHPLTFLRSRLREKGVIPAAMAKETRSGRIVTVAGLVLFRQQPGTAHGTIFLSIEDETGVLNLIVWDSLKGKFRSVVYAAKLLVCRGEIQREGQVLHVIARQLWDWSEQLRELHKEHTTPELPVHTRSFR